MFDIIRGSIGEWAEISVVITAITTLIALLATVHQFNRTQLFTLEAQAVDLFARFNKLNIDQNQSRNSNTDRWYGNSKFAITEALFELTKSDKAWESTLMWMLDEQKLFIKSGGFVLESYSTDFRDFCQKHGYELTRALNR